MASIKCPKCGMDLNDDCMIVWKCAECGKAFKVSFSKLQQIHELKKKKSGQHLIKCSSCGHPMDNGNEKISCKCSSCGNVLGGNLTYFVGDDNGTNDNVEIDASDSYPDMIECPDCGKRILSDSKICSYCGYLLKEKEEEKKNLIKCPECGNEISDSAKECVHCGFPIHPHSTGEKVGKIFLIIGIVSVLGSLIYEMATADERLRLRAYALTHNNYYPTSYYISSFFSSFAANGGIILAVIGIIILIVFRNKK